MATSERLEHFPRRSEATVRGHFPDACPCCDGPVRIGFKCQCGEPEVGTAYLVYARGGVVWLECPVCGEVGFPIRVANPLKNEKISRTQLRVGPGRRGPKEPPPSIPDAFLR